MIKRAVLFCIVALLSVQVSSAQFSAKFGVKGGMGSGKYEFTKSIYDDYRVSTSGRTGLHVGMFARLKFLALHIQPELIYTYERYSLRTLYNEEASSSTVRMSSIDLPLLLGVNLMWLRFQFGPVINLTTDVSQRHRDGEKQWIHLEKPSISFMLGVGADLARFTFDVRYHGQFKRPTQHTAIGSEDPFRGKMKFRSWLFSLGYMF